MPASAQSARTFDVVQRARMCAPNRADPRQSDCEFRVGKALRFTIAGVGTADAGIYFAKSDADGDYYAAVGLEHHCIIVWPGDETIAKMQSRVIDLAFVSPVNGKVYKDWGSCAKARR